MLTQARLKELLSYDPETGIFIRLTNTGGKLSGIIAGSPHSSGGYIKIMADRKKYFAHRLAWLYQTGEWPTAHIDHIDGNKANNTFENLRNVTQSINLQNQKRARSSNRSTGILGAYSYGDRFVACINILGRKTHLGVFDTVEDAHAAYLRAKREFHDGCTI